MTTGPTVSGPREPGIAPEDATEEETLAYLY